MDHPLLPVHESSTSLLLAMENMAALEDHIRVPALRCHHCILKHALLARAYAREAIGLLNPPASAVELSDRIDTITSLVLATGDIFTAADEIRILRHNL